MIRYENEFAKYIMPENNSRWADKEELTKISTLVKIDIESDIYSGSGIPVISDGKTVYVDNSDTHTIIFGSTGSKKTRLFVMPLLNIITMAGESFIATDPKGELFERTSGLAKNNGYDIYVLNFRELEKSDHWNPLAIPYDLYHNGNVEEAISMINDLINALMAPQYTSTKERFWLDQGASIFLGYILFFIHSAQKNEANLYNLAKFFYEYSSIVKAKELVELMAPGSVAWMSLKAVLTTGSSEKTYDSIISSASVILKNFTVNKSLCQMLSTSSIDIAKIGKKKTGIFIIVPDEKTTLHELVTMFVKQTYESLIHQAQKENNINLPVRLNFVLDEFANIPTIPDMPSMISAARSRNMRFYLIVQGMKQLYQKYDKQADTIKGNCDNWVFLASKEYELLKEISLLCGYKNDNKELINVTQLQQLKKEWEQSECLIMHGRNHPYVSVLPDINIYKFKTVKPIKRDSKKLPDLVSFDYEKVYKEFVQKKRKLAFCEEVKLENEYFEVITKNDKIDWDY